MMVKSSISLVIPTMELQNNHAGLIYFQITHSNRKKVLDFISIVRLTQLIGTLYYNICIGRSLNPVHIIYSPYKGEILTDRLLDQK